MEASEDADVLMVDGDISELETTERIVSGAIDRFGRIDTLVNGTGEFTFPSLFSNTPEKTTTPSWV